MNRNNRIALTGILALMLFTGCTEPAAVKDTPIEAITPEVKPVETAVPENVNEAGRIPILMYHRIIESKSEYDRTPEQFRMDMERLYKDGYRPISLKDFVAGRVNVPAGCSPVVITFDDGDRSQYRTEGSGTVSTPDSAVGIMEAFRVAHPDFNPQATFFVNGGVPFGEKLALNDKLKYLVQRGYTIGNHTWAHENLSKLSAEEIQTTLGKNAGALQTITGEPVNLLALPYGIRPKDPAAMAAVVSGTFEGLDYSNVGICNVGWQPELPAYIEGFDATAINRIRSGDDAGEAGDWLNRLAEHPENRYISDGDPNTVTVPASKAPLVNKAALGEMKLRIIE